MTVHKKKFIFYVRENLNQNIWATRSTRSYENIHSNARLFCSHENIQENLPKRLSEVVSK